MTSKVCSKCKIEQSFINFDKREKGRLASHCKKCRAIRTKEYYFSVYKTKAQRYNQENKELVSNKRKLRYNPTQRKISSLKNTFNLTLNQYNDILKKQDNVCAICKKPETSKTNVGNLKSLAVDHCHKTGEIRGLLCMYCNTGLGKFKDDTMLLQSAINYLTGVK